MIGPDSVLKARDDVRYRIVDRQAVLIRQNDPEAVILNEVGARVLGLIEERSPVGQMLDRMAEEFEVDRAVLERDVLAFLQELLDTGIAEEA
jgi:hypothetical protein